MKIFMGEDFLLQSDAAVHLWNEYAREQPIIDYHCHLPPRDIAENHRFGNLAELWLQSDHYKWRVMRTAGVDEKYITGHASDKEKYLAWADVVPKTAGNPVFHWTHLELKRFFGISDRILSPSTAEDIWKHCQEKLATPAFSARGLMAQMNVQMVGTTDDPLDSLEWHRKLHQGGNIDVQILPTWRPDPLFKPGTPGFADYIQQLSLLTGNAIHHISELKSAVLHRLDFFEQHGCRIADHGIDEMVFSPENREHVLDDIFKRRLNGDILSESDQIHFTSALQVWLGQEYARRGWVMQLHIGAQRDNNSRAFAGTGANCGYDSISDKPFARSLAQYLDALERTDELPRTIIYTLNPAWNEVVATLCGNFQKGGTPGKIQFGSGWWFNDQLDGMQRQLEQLSQLGLLSQFVGMLTDSRSFLSFTRHEYFRRLLCNHIGGWMARGEVPPDFELMGKMVSDICFHNAVNYFQIK